MKRRILIADDSETTRKNLQKILETDPDLEVVAVANGKQALEQLVAQPYSLALVDLRMPGVDGMEVIEEVQKRRLPVTVIVTTGHGSIEEAVRAIRLGAYDFLTKPIEVDHLRLILQRALRERALQDEVVTLRNRLQAQYAFQNILSKNPRMHAIFELISHVAQTPTTVLIEGETGTGKEQVARAIHNSCPLRTGPLVAVNCAALPENLLESELFGHEKGSFTGAVGMRKGRFEMADGGTIFLDEVGDVPASMQAKLLRVLQERQFERVGGTDTVEVDVRVIAATNRSLLQMVKQGKFREDLYYRLNVVKIDLPPLHERAEDIPLLVSHFMQKYARPDGGPKHIAPEAMEVLLKYRWPGNVRELENVIERACVTTREDTIRAETLPADLLTAAPSKGSAPPIDLTRPMSEQLPEVIEAFEKRYIRRALKKVRGHVGRCARICGISRRSMTAKIAQYNIDKKLFKLE
jgi:DNA-binding NtrC family response regulator